MSKIGKDVLGKPAKPPKLKEFSPEEKEELRKKWQELDRPPEKEAKEEAEKPKKRETREREPTPSEKRYAEAKKWAKEVDEQRKEREKHPERLVEGEPETSSDWMKERITPPEKKQKQEL